MDMNTYKKRDSYVDFLRGIAMLIVIFGHTMAESTTGSTDSVLFNIVWSLQMPLFILISGYVTRYGRAPTNAREMFALLGKRTLAYLLPWFVFTVLFNGLILGKQILTPEALFRQMDRGYWFLITLWTISVIFILARFAASKLCRRAESVPWVTLCFYLIGMVLLSGLGYFAGFDFFCIKLTLYYMPFYFLGYLYGFYHDKIEERFSTAVSIAVAAAALIWIVAIVKLNLYSLSDTDVSDFLLRAGVSLCGCIAVCGMMRTVKNTSPVYRFVGWIGSHTIEVYMLHYYFLNPVMLAATPACFSARGIALTAVNFVITVTTVTIVAGLLDANRYLSLILFGRIPKKK